MSVDFWVEVASPLKNPLKEAFLNYSKEVYEKQNIFVSSYFPSVMGGDMPVEDYLINMDVRDAPENYLTMGFGECSSDAFFNKYVKSGVYRISEIVAWFPEAMVIDTRRLASRPVPTNYYDLASPCYRGEICIIGTPEIPDPLAALYIYKEKGLDIARRFIDNIAGFGAPVDAIRHIGKSSNSFASIFIMPMLFADVCREIKSAIVIQSDGGFFAEPFILFSKDEKKEKNKIVKDFIASSFFKEVFLQKSFMISSESDEYIYDGCKSTCFPELKKLYPLLKKF